MAVFPQVSAQHESDLGTGDVRGKPSLTDEVNVTLYSASERGESGLAVAQQCLQAGIFNPPFFAAGIHAIDAGSQ